MQLHSLAVEHFRAIRSGTVTFDQTTVLVGENNCGKTSLLEALALVLDPTAGTRPVRLLPHHLHRPGSGPNSPATGPLRIVLGYRERRVGEWNPHLDSPIGALLRPGGTGPRELEVELRAASSGSDDDLHVDWCIRRVDVEAPVTTDVAALAWLRQVSPLIWLSRGRLAGAPHQVPAGEGRQGAFSPEMSPLADRIRTAHAAVVTGTTLDVDATLAEGFAAANEVIGLAARHLGGQPHNFRQIVADVLEGRPPVPGTGTAVEPHFGGAAAERVGVLALVAALVDALPGTLATNAHPIWVIEDPEAHLHPMTLAAVMKLVAHIKWQKVITTQSGEVLAAEPLSSLRRITRTNGVLREWRVPQRGLSARDLRRVGYHLRGRRGMANFARCWLLVEGETEFWLVPELARTLGYDFAIEGIVCVEFAQCGLPPLIALARNLGIEWHVLSDGDAAGRIYADRAASLAPRADRDRRVTMLAEPDIEHCFFAHGYAALFRRLAGPAGREGSARRVIGRAIDRRSKPMVALDLVVAAAARGPKGVPPPVRRLIETCVSLARSPVAPTE